MKKLMLVVVAVLTLNTGCASMLVGGVYKATSSPDLVQSPPDEISGVSFVRPEFAIKPGAGYYLYYGVQKTKNKGPMRAAFETWNRDWLFVEKVILKVDEKVFEVPIPNNEWDRDVIPGGEYTPTMCAERADVNLGAEHGDLVAAMCVANKIIIRFQGRHSQRTLDTENPVFLQGVKNVCASYLGGDPKTILSKNQGALAPAAPAAVAPTATAQVGVDPVLWSPPHCGRRISGCDASSRRTPLSSGRGSSSSSEQAGRSRAS